MNHPRIIPTLKYKDAAAAITWLKAAFGFEPHLVVPGPEGTIRHAQLTFAGGMIMLGSAGDTEFDAWQKPPAAVGGVGTGSAYIIVDDVDAHHARALAAGAEVLYGPVEEEQRGKAYSCKDPEGQLWNFGSYDPFL